MVMDTIFDNDVKMERQPHVKCRYCGAFSRPGQKRWRFPECFKARQTERKMTSCPTEVRPFWSLHRKTCLRAGTNWRQPIGGISRGPAPLLRPMGDGVPRRGRELMAELSGCGSANGKWEVIKEKRLMCGSPSVERVWNAGLPVASFIIICLAGGSASRQTENNPLHLSPSLTLSLVPSYLLSFSFISTYPAYFLHPSFNTLRSISPFICSTSAFSSQNTSYFFFVQRPTSLVKPFEYDVHGHFWHYKAFLKLNHKAFNGRQTLRLFLTTQQWCKFPTLCSSSLVSLQKTQHTWHIFLRFCFHRSLRAPRWKLIANVKPA